MSLLKQEKQITRFFIFTQIAGPLFSIIALIIYPPDFSKEFPVYAPNSVMMMILGVSIWIAGFTVMGIKLADEKKVLAAAGFTMLAVSAAISLTSLFEICLITSYEAYVKFYFIQTSGNILYVPAMYLITRHKDFNLWSRYIGLLGSLIQITASFMFMSGNRDFNTLETISNIGIFIFFLTTFSWAYNAHINHKKAIKHMEKQPSTPAPVVTANL